MRDYRETICPLHVLAMGKRPKYPPDRRLRETMVRSGCQSGDKRHISASTENRTPALQPVAINLLTVNSAAHTIKTKTSYNNENNSELYS
jgi:hypothetical protein